jgi:hypothetical protein
MFAMQHCSRKEQWRDFTDHPEAELIGELAKALAACIVIWDGALWF